MAEDKNILEKTADAAKGAADGARSKIHEMTKGEEDKTMQDKAEEAAPDNAEDAGQKVGSAVDGAMSKAKDAVSDAQKN